MEGKKKRYNEKWEKILATTLLITIFVADVPYWSFVRSGEWEQFSISSVLIATSNLLQS